MNLKKRINQIKNFYYLVFKMSESSSSKTTLFAVRTTIGREKIVQDMIFHRLQVIYPLPDIKSIITTDVYRGYVFVEAIHQNDVVRLVSGVPHVRGKVVGSISLAAIDAAITTETSLTRLEEGDKVEIIKGPFQGNKAQIINVSKEGSSEKVKIKLIDSDSPITLDIHMDYLKVIEKSKKVAKEYVIKPKELEPAEDITKESEKQKELTELDELKVQKPKKKKTKKKEEEISEETIPSPLLNESTKLVITESKDIIDSAQKYSFDNLEDEEYEGIDKFSDQETEEEIEEDEEEDEDSWAKFF